jgi:hypothetical protein
VDGQERIAAVDKASRKPIRQSDRLVRLVQQQRSGVRRNHPAIEIRHNPPPATPSKTNFYQALFCRETEFVSSGCGRPVPQFAPEMWPDCLHDR